MEPVTSIGYERIREELKKYMAERPIIINAIAEARGHGDLSENAEYHAARERQSFIEGRILELGAKIATVKIIDLKTIPTNCIVFGSRVKLLDLNTNEEVEYNIVSELESDPKIGWISYKCPLGQAMMTKEKGDIVDHSFAGIEKEYEVISIKRMKKIK